jgi:hypothetical protein
MTSSKYQDFFSQLPSGTSELSTLKGETVVIVKSLDGVTLTKENAQHAVTHPLLPSRRLNFSFVAEATQAGAYVFSECWQEADSPEELALHYPTNVTNRFVAERLIEDVIQHTQLVGA